MKKPKAEFVFTHLNILLILLGMVIIILAERIVGVLNYVVGGTLALFSLTVFIYTMINYRRTSVFANNVSAAIITALAAGLIFFLKENAVQTIAIAWAIFGLFKGGREIAETINKIMMKRQFILTLLQALVTLVFAALLILDPLEHLHFHMIILGIEIMLVSMKAYKARTSFLKSLPLEEHEITAIKGTLLNTEKGEENESIDDKRQPE